MVRPQIRKIGLRMVQLASNLLEVSNSNLPQLHYMWCCTPPSPSLSMEESWRQAGEAWRDVGRMCPVKNICTKCKI